MAGTIQLRIPEAFSFNKPDEWLKWHKTFEQFQVASGLSVEGQARQVSTLLYCMGEEAEEYNLPLVIVKGDKPSLFGRNWLEKKVRLGGDFFQLVSPTQ